MLSLLFLGPKFFFSPSRSKLTDLIKAKERTREQTLIHLYLSFACFFHFVSFVEVCCTVVCDKDRLNPKACISISVFQMIFLLIFPSILDSCLVGQPHFKINLLEFVCIYAHNDLFMHLSID